MRRLPSAEKRRIRSETEILAELQHPHIINFYHVWENKEQDQICFTTEIVTSGTLKQYTNRVKGIKLKVIKKWCRQILTALEYLHSMMIIHRDLKCDNIFINGGTGEIRLGDFGLSAHRTCTHVASVLGTPEFMAPELYEENYSEAVDIYAFGMCTSPDDLVLLSSGKSIRARDLRVGDQLVGVDADQPTFVQIISPPVIEGVQRVFPTCDTMYRITHHDHFDYTVTPDHLIPIITDRLPILTISRDPTNPQLHTISIVGIDKRTLNRTTFTHHTCLITPRSIELNATPSSEIPPTSHDSSTLIGTDSAHLSAQVWDIFHQRRRQVGTLESACMFPGDEPLLIRAESLCTALNTDSNIADYIRVIEAEPSEIIQPSLPPLHHILTHTVSPDFHSHPCTSTWSDHHHDWTMTCTNDPISLVIVLSHPSQDDTPAIHKDGRKTKLVTNIEHAVAVADISLHGITLTTATDMLMILSQLCADRLIVCGSAARTRWLQISQLAGVTDVRHNVSQDGYEYLSFNFVSPDSAPPIAHRRVTIWFTGHPGEAFRLHHFVGALQSAAELTVTSELTVARLKLAQFGFKSVCEIRRPAQEFVRIQVNAPHLYSMGNRALTHNCVLEMTSKEYPYEECSNAAQIWKKVTSGQKPDVLNRVKDQQVREFINLCICAHENRLSASELLNHPFLAFRKSDSFVRDNLIVSVEPRSRPGTTPNPSSTGVSSIVVEIESTQGPNAHVVLHIHLDHGRRKKQIKFALDFRTDTGMSLAGEMVQSLKLPDAERTQSLIASAMEAKIEPIRKAYFAAVAKEKEQSNGNTTVDPNHPAVATPSQQKLLEQQRMEQQRIEQQRIEQQRLEQQRANSSSSLATSRAPTPTEKAPSINHSTLTNRTPTGASVPHPTPLVSQPTPKANPLQTPTSSLPLSTRPVVPQPTLPNPRPTHTPTPTSTGGRSSLPPTLNPTPTPTPAHKYTGSLPFEEHHFNALKDLHASPSPKHVGLNSTTNLHTSTNASQRSFQLDHLLTLDSFETSEEYEAYLEKEFKALSVSALKEKLKGKPGGADLVKACFPESDTRILTSKGWLFLHQIERYIERNESILYSCFDVATQSIVYRHGSLVYSGAPDRFVEFSQQSLESKSNHTVGVSIRVTPNHRMYVHTSTSAAPHLITADALIKHHADAFNMLTAAPAGVSSNDGLRPDESDADSPITQLSLNSVPKINAFLQLFGAWLAGRFATLDSNGADVTINAKGQSQLIHSILGHLESTRSADWSLSPADSDLIIIHHSMWASYFRSLSISRCPDWFIHRLTREQTRLILDMAANLQSSLLTHTTIKSGITNASSIESILHTNSSVIRDQLLQACLHAGYSAHFVESHDSHWSICYTDSTSVSLRPTDVAYSRPYSPQLDGRVWCVDVAHDDHLIMAQRTFTNADGVTIDASTPVIIGNCFEKPDLIQMLIKITVQEHGNTPKASGGNTIAAGNMASSFANHSPASFTPSGETPDFLSPDPPTVPTSPHYVSSPPIISPDPFVGLDDLMKSPVEDSFATGLSSADHRFAQTKRVSMPPLQSESSHTNKPRHHVHHSIDSLPSSTPSHTGNDFPFSPAGQPFSHYSDSNSARSHLTSDLSEDPANDPSSAFDFQVSVTSPASSPDVGLDAPVDFLSPTSSANGLDDPSDSSYDLLAGNGPVAPRHTRSSSSGRVRIGSSLGGVLEHTDEDDPSQRVTGGNHRLARDSERTDSSLSSLDDLMASPDPPPNSSPNRSNPNEHTFFVKSRKTDLVAPNSAHHLIPGSAALDQLRERQRAAGVRTLPTDFSQLGDYLLHDGPVSATGTKAQRSHTAADVDTFDPLFFVQSSTPTSSLPTPSASSLTSSPHISPLDRLHKGTQSMSIPMQQSNATSIFNVAAAGGLMHSKEALESRKQQRTKSEADQAEAAILQGFRM